MTVDELFKNRNAYGSNTCNIAIPTVDVGGRQ